MNILENLEKLSEAWLVKLCFAFLLNIIGSTHVQLFGLFAVLVFGDLFTKWLSLARQMLVDKGVKDPSLWRAFISLRKARRKGYIRSEEMRTRFVHKMLAYFLVVLSGGMLDLMLLRMEITAYAANLAVGYFAVTEFISILENLQQTGIKEAGALVDLVKKKGCLK